MKTFLSIDWDYFFTATEFDRIMYFPDGREYEEDSICDYIWSTKYAKDSPVPSIDVDRESLRKIRSIIDKIIAVHGGSAPIQIAESHLWAYHFITSLTHKKETFQVLNIDYHHDLYDYCEELNCGNWVNNLYRERPNLEYTWLARKDSEDLDSAERDDEFNLRVVHSFSVIDDDFINNCAGIFICKSSMWSPPHLDSFLCRLANRIMKKNSTTSLLDNGVLKQRPYGNHNEKDFSAQLSMLKFLADKYRL